jgi:hypothetical protein
VFAPDAIAFAITIAASAVPALGTALKSYFFRKGHTEIKVKGNVRSDPVLGRDYESAGGPITGSFPAASSEDTQKIRISPSPAPPATHRFVAWLSVIGLVVALASLYFVLASRSAPASNPNTSGIEPPSQLIAALIWLSAHELFYQLMFIFVALCVIFFNKRRVVAVAHRLDASGQLLLGFACIVFFFGGSAAIHYWQRLYLTADKFYLALGLFFTMVAGMFVQVITSNYKAGATSLLSVTTAQLVYPVLFSPIVYYAIWAVASVSASAGLFSFYAAFLNGYFWQSVVTSAQKASTVTASGV